MSRNNGRQELFFPRIALLLLISSVFLGIQQVFSSNDWFSFGNFKKLPGHSLIGNVTGTHKFPDDLTCAFACVGDTQCFSFNFGGTSIDNLFTCELSNSLGAWDPQNLKNRPGFDLYEVVDRVLVHPCLSSPCHNGGTCVEHKGNYKCNCPLEIAVLLYIDDKCNVQMDLITTYKSNRGVFHAEANGIYKLNFHEAERLCELLGATLASYDQLDQAYKAGYGLCHYGWLADGTLRYPMQGAYPRCGNRTGIIGSSEVVTDKLNTRKDAYCYKATG